MSSKLSLTNRKSLRHKFGVLTDTVNMPNLIEIQQEHMRKIALGSSW